MIYRFDVIPMGYKRMTQFSKFNAEIQPYYRYQNDLRLLAANQGFTLPDVFKVTFQLPMPRSWSDKKKRAAEGTAHQQKPDLDNLLKVVCDALGEDDRTIYAVMAEKRWGYEGQILIEV